LGVSKIDNAVIFLKNQDIPASYYIDKDMGNGRLCERGKGREVIAPLSKCRDERSEFYGRKEGKGRFYAGKKVKQKNLLHIF